jgi:hypothetical protein
MDPHELQDATPIEGLAYLASASVEDCLREGAKWTLLRVLGRRYPIQTIMVIRRLTGLGIAYGKTVVGLATESRIEALGVAIDARDASAALAVLREWMADDLAENERLVQGLLAAFAPSPERHA